MPATSLKPLYLAKSMQELEILAESKADIKKKQSSQLISSANTLFQAGEKCSLERDEEKAFTMFMRFLEVVMELQNRPDFKVSSHFKGVMKNANLGIVKAEDLKKSLRNRYPKVFEDINCKVKNEKNDAISAALHDQKPDVTAGGDIFNDVKKVSQVAETSMSCSKLFSLLTTNQSNIILMDVRLEKDFEESHVKHGHCINVPAEILAPGLTAAKLERLLPSDSLPAWNVRGEADYVILIDWNSTDDSKPNSSLHVLKQAITKWDQKCTLKKPPLILQGGYKDWMLKYPMYTTQALNFSFLHSDARTPSVVADVSNVDYPNLDENVSEKVSPPKENTNEPLFKRTADGHPLTNNSISNDLTHPRSTKSAPAFDRKSKPSNVHLKPSTAVPVHTLGKKRENGVVLPGGQEEERKAHHLASLVKEECLTKDYLALAKEQLSKEQEFEKLCLRKEKEAEEDRRIEIQKQESLLVEKLKELNTSMTEKEAECQKVKEENEKMKKLLNEYKDKELQKQKEKVMAAHEERRHLQEQVKRLREERKAKKKLESKPESIPRNISSANSGLKRHTDTHNSNNSHNSEYQVPLSSEGSRSNLRRSHSSPNIAELINPEESNQRKIPAYDRSLKPGTPISQPVEINRARYRNLNPIYGNCPATGLKNLGNTCFMNSVIQCLSNTVPLAEYFISNQYLEDINRENRQREVADEFAIVLRNLWMGTYKSFSPSEFKDCVSKCLSVCIGNEQQDSHEFLVVLMDKLHAALNTRSVKTIPKLESCPDENAFWLHHRNYNSSIISDIFEGLLKSTLTCMTCQKTSDSYEVFSCLSLPILSSRCSLRDCFRHFLKSEKICGEAAWDCPKCKQKKEAQKRLCISRLPDMLVIQLKRFSYEGLWRRKLQTHVDFDFSFDVPFETNSEDHLRKYALYGVVNHFGTLEGGHYTAFCNTNSNKWYKYDDHEVSEISSSDIRTSAAYLLFYRASDLRSNL